MAEPADVLHVTDLAVSFKKSRGWLRRPSEVRPVDGVSLTVRAGETLGLVGESGCGKSTTARAILRLVEPERGSVVIDGKNLADLSSRQLRKIRQDIQMVFQDPYSSLDPSMIVGDSIGEPLAIHRGMSGDAKYRRVGELMESVGLPAAYMSRYPHEFSGGQRQRLAIARALASDPKVIVCDEAVSALDVSSQSQVLDLLKTLAETSDVTYLFISHDLSVVRSVSQNVAVMYLGRIVEHGPVEEVFDRPSHPYTYSLLSAIPVPSPAEQRTRDRVILAGEPPDPARVPSGCRFHPRCPLAMDICRTVEPELVDHGRGVKAACHLHTSGPHLNGDSVAEVFTAVRTTGRGREAARVPEDASESA